MAGRGNVRVSITAETSGLQRGARQAETSLGRVGKASEGAGHHLASLAKAGLAAGAALVSVAEAKNAIETTEGLAKSTITLSRNFGLSATQASTWSSVLKVNNVDARSAQMSFTSLSKAIVSAGEGSKPAVEAFKKLGISQQDLKGQNFGQVLDEVTKALTEMKGGTDRAQASQALLGRGAKVLAPLFRGDGLGFQQQAKWATQYGATLDGHAIKNSKELVIATEKLKFAQLGMQIAFTEHVAPALIKVGTALAGFVNQMRTGEGAGGQFAAVLRTIGGVMGTLVKFFAQNRTALRALEAAVVVLTAAWVGYRLAALAAAVATTIATGGLNLIVPAVAALAAGLVVAYERSAKFRAVVDATFKVAKDVVLTTVHVILTVLDKFLGGLQSVMEAASHLPIVGKKFNGIADDIGNAREKVRGLRDAVDNLNGRKVSVTVQVNALLSEFNAGKIPKFGTLSKPGQSHAMGGIVVPGSGSGDKVPLQAMVEPGEQIFVLNRNASAVLDYLQGVNAAVPRFAAGGRLSLAHPGSQIRQAAVEMSEGRSAQWLKAHPMPSGGAGAAAGVGGVGGSFAKNRDLARRMVTAAFGADQFAPFDILEMHEAGYNPFARNSKSGAFGIPQALPPTKMPLAAQRGDVRSQLLWMISYIRGRYGNPANAWAQYYAHPGGVGYYAEGGPVVTGGKPQGVFERRSKVIPPRALALMRKVWISARNFYPGAAGHGMPHTLDLPLHDLPFVGDVQNPGTRKGQFINWPDFMSQMLLSKKPGWSDAGLETLVHEWAHYFQKPTLPLWQAEGGAEAFAHMFGKTIMGAAGVPYKTSLMGTYLPYRRRVEKQLGPRWVAKGQFAKLQRGGIVRAQVGALIAKAKPPAKSRHWNPFKNVYQMLTSKQYKALQAEWQKKHPKLSMPTGPTKRKPAEKLGPRAPLVPGLGTIEDILSNFDTAVEAGDLSPEQAATQAGFIFADALKHPRKYHLSPQDVERLKVDRGTFSLSHFQGETPAATAAAGSSGGDPNQPLIDAINNLAQEQKDLKGEMKRTNDINQSVLAISGREALRLMADAISGQVGYKVNTASYTPGFGVGARY